jgi:Tectonin domain
VGIGYQDNCHPYEVWGLNPGANIYRYNFCGQNFEQVAGTLGTLSVGGGDIWGINGNGNIFAFNFATLGFDQALSNNRFTGHSRPEWCVGARPVG